MKRELWSKMHPVVVECSTSLFDAYGVQVSYAGEAARALVRDEGVAAFIGLSGEMIRGTLVISASFKLLQQVHPVAMTGRLPSEDDQRDWTGEMANQLLGRLKIKLAAYGLRFSLSTPTTLVGRELRGVGGEPDGAHFIVFRSGEAEIYVQFEAQVVPEFVLIDPSIAEPPPVIEGEMMLF